MSNSYKEYASKEFVKEQMDSVVADLHETIDDKADAEHTHNTSDLRGATSIANGGTGATTAEDAKTNLGIPTIHSGTIAPSNSLGKDGDIYIMYS
jgi:hypothetical protein